MSNLIDRIHNKLMTKNVLKYTPCLKCVRESQIKTKWIVGLVHRLHYKVQIQTS